MHGWTKDPARRAIYRRLMNSKDYKLARRAAWLRDKGLCQNCLRQGYVRAAQEVHHLRPVEWGRDEKAMRERCLDVGNLECLCHECHFHIHMAMKSRSKMRQKGQSQARMEAQVDALLRPEGAVLKTPSPPA